MDYVVDVISGKRLWYSARIDRVLTQVLYALSKSESHKDLFDENGWMDFEGFESFLHKFQKDINFGLYPYSLGIKISEDKYAPFENVIFLYDEKNKDKTKSLEAKPILSEDFWDDLSILVNTGVAEYKTQDNKFKVRITNSGKHYAETTYSVYPELREFIDTIHPIYNPFFINVGDTKDLGLSLLK